jgi:hypothetical protein
MIELVKLFSNDEWYNGLVTFSAGTKAASTANRGAGEVPQEDHRRAAALWCYKIRNTWSRRSCPSVDRSIPRLREDRPLNSCTHIWISISRRGFQKRPNWSNQEPMSWWTANRRFQLSLWFSHCQSEAREGSKEAAGQRRWILRGWLIPSAAYLWVELGAGVPAMFDALLLRPLAFRCPIFAAS